MASSLTMASSIGTMGITCGCYSMAGKQVRPAVGLEPRSMPQRPQQRNLAVAKASGESTGQGVVVIGAGLAGLACATKLHEKGVQVTVLEASDGVGGRARTDRVEGFLLDRGFAILLSSYPEQASAVDLKALNLGSFYAGAAVRHGGAFHRVADPFRHPVDALATLSPSHAVGSPLDKVRVGVLRLKAMSKTVDDIWRMPETPTRDLLAAEGFSDSIIDRFFRPFLGGIFFDRDLGTSSRLTMFVMKMLASGSNCLPEDGIGAIAAQLAGRLPEGCVRLNTRVSALEGTAVTMSGGEVLRASCVVVATEGPEASRLLGESMSGPAASKTPVEPGVGTACVYFKAPRHPSEEALLYLNGEGTGIVNNCCFPATVQPSYAPPGKALVSASTVGVPDMSDEELVRAVKDHLGEWFGREEVAAWEPLRVYRIPYAQPPQGVPTDQGRPVSLGGGVFVCGDHRTAATHDGAIASGWMAAQAVLASLQ